MTRRLIAFTAVACLVAGAGAFSSVAAADGAAGHSRQPLVHEVGGRHDRRDNDCWVTRQWTPHGYRRVVQCDRPKRMHKQHQKSQGRQQVYTHVRPTPVPVLPQGTVYGADFQDGYGRYCREYQSQAMINGRWQQVYGTACRNPDGSWALVR